jgi:hypothetical protein
MLGCLIACCIDAGQQLSDWACVGCAIETAFPRRYAVLVFWHLRGDISGLCYLSPALCGCRRWFMPHQDLPDACTCAGSLGGMHVKCTMRQDAPVLWRGTVSSRLLAADVLCWYTFI